MLKNQMIYVMTHHLGIIFSWIIRIVKHEQVKHQLSISINISMCIRSDTQF